MIDIPADLSWALVAFHDAGGKDRFLSLARVIGAEVCTPHTDSRPNPQIVYLIQRCYLNEKTQTWEPSQRVLEVAGDFPYKARWFVMALGASPEDATRWIERDIEAWFNPDPYVKGNGGGLPPDLRARAEPVIEAKLDQA